MWAYSGRFLHIEGAKPGLCRGSISELECGLHRQKQLEEPELLALTTAVRGRSTLSGSGSFFQPA